MYYVQKMTMAGIAVAYNVSVDCVAYFMRKHKIERRTPAESNGINFLKSPTSFTYNDPKNEEDRIIESMGIMLYWAEGFKSEGSTVDFANSDPKMIKLFLVFLRNSFTIDESKLRIYLYCYSNQDVSELIKYWSALCNIPQDQFSQPYIRKDFNPLQKRVMKHGLIHVRYNDKRLLSEIKKMIECYSVKYAPVE